MSERRVEELFERFRSSGDAAALGCVFDEVAPVLQRVARHLAHDRAEAEDLVQATFLVAIEKRETFDSMRKLEPWLTGILLKQASLARRARARVIEPDRLDSRTSEDPLDVAGAREMSEALTVALSRLSPSDREVLLPLLMDGRRAVEIARELGRRPDTVHMRIHRGLARLRRLLPASFAIAALGRASHARGLGAVKAEVLRRAGAEFGVASGAGVSVAVTTWGIAMTTKQIAVAAAVLAVALAAGGYWLAPTLRGASSTNLSDHSAEIAQPTNDSAPGSTTVAQVVPAAVDSTRTELPALATPESPRTVELEILRSDEHPAAGALIAFVDSSKTLTSAKTDDNGLCKLATNTTIADVYVRDDGSLPFHARVDIAGKDKLTIDLPSGADLSGRLIMMGDEALPDIELRLSTDSAPAGFTGADLAVFKSLDLMNYDYKEIVARTHPLANGSFHFHGLPDGWSGVLSLPEGLGFVVDGNEAESSEQVFHSASTGVDLRVGFYPRITGRLVDDATGLPIRKASVDGMFHRSNGCDRGLAFVTDEKGRFALVIGSRTDTVSIKMDCIHASNGAVGRSLDNPKWSGEFKPFDAGDIKCTFPPARELVVHVVDAVGIPLSGAHAAIGELAIVAADEKGDCKFPAVPIDSTQMLVVAPGHAIVKVPLSKEITSPLTVVLPLTNVLTIALPHEVVGNPDFQIALVSPPRLFGGTTRRYYQSLRGGMVGRWWSTDVDTGTKEGAAFIGFSDEGRIELEDLRTGVPFRVQLRTELYTDEGIVAEVRVDSLGPQEHRLIQFKTSDLVGHTVRTVRGHVTDENGQAISGARVGDRIASGSMRTSSELDGSFKMHVGAHESTDVEVWKRGYVPFRMHDWSVTADKVLEVRLRRGEDLRVEYVDPRGHPVDQVSLEADIEGHGEPTLEGSGVGVFNLLDLPEGSVQLNALVAGKRYANSFDCHAGVARITLPEHGRLEVTWKREGHQEDNLWLMLRPTGAEGVEQLEFVAWLDRIPTFVFASVLPGEYTIGFETGLSPDDDGAHAVWTKRSEPIHVTIEAGKTRSIVIPP